jgi:GntR family transcriptional regulator, transcriptional repressor for pyruvate dehydrogenase complex
VCLSAGTQEPEASSQDTTAPGWIKPVRGRRTFEEVIDQLETALLDGQLVAGARLPAEREFAAALGVSRPSLREALRVLEALNIVDVHRGPAGVVLRREPGDAFAQILRLHLALGHYPGDSIVELRCILESWAFGETAGRRDPELLEELADLLSGMADPSVDPLKYHALDVQFHSAVVDGCGNGLVTVVLRGCRTVISQSMFDAVPPNQWPERARVLTREHEELFEAIKLGDAETASELVRRHIRKWTAAAAGRSASPVSEPSRHGDRDR